MRRAAEPQVSPGRPEAFPTLVFQQCPHSRKSFQLFQNWVGKGLLEKTRRSLFFWKRRESAGEGERQKDSGVTERVRPVRPAHSKFTPRSFPLKYFSQRMLGGNLCFLPSRPKGQRGWRGAVGPRMEAEAPNCSRTLQERGTAAGRNPKHNSEIHCYNQCPHLMGQSS